MTALATFNALNQDALYTSAVLDCHRLGVDQFTRGVLAVLDACFHDICSTGVDVDGLDAISQYEEFIGRPTTNVPSGISPEWDVFNDVLFSRISRQAMLSLGHVTLDYILSSERADLIPDIDTYDTDDTIADHSARKAITPECMAALATLNDDQCSCISVCKILEDDNFVKTLNDQMLLDALLASYSMINPVACSKIIAFCIDSGITIPFQDDRQFGGFVDDDLIALIGLTESLGRVAPNLTECVHASTMCDPRVLDAYVAVYISTISLRMKVHIIFQIEAAIAHTNPSVETLARLNRVLASLV